MSAGGTVRRPWHNCEFAIYGWLSSIAVCGEVIPRVGQEKQDAPAWAARRIAVPGPRASFWIHVGTYARDAMLTVSVSVSGKLLAAKNCGNEKDRGEEHRDKCRRAESAAEQVGGGYGPTRFPPITTLSPGKAAVGFRASVRRRSIRVIRAACWNRC
jgi:hypothetical protein